MHGSRQHIMRADRAQRAADSAGTDAACNQMSRACSKLLLPLQVLEGWLFLGNIQELGSRLTNACMAAVSTSCAQTVRSVLLTQPALAPRALTAASMQDLIRDVPSDLFRTCLAQVLHRAPSLLILEKLPHILLLLSTG